jgi:hypothetical protein
MRQCKFKLTLPPVFKVLTHLPGPTSLEASAYPVLPEGCASALTANPIILSKLPEVTLPILPRDFEIPFKSALIPLMFAEIPANCRIFAGLTKPLSGFADYLWGNTLLI